MTKELKRNWFKIAIVIVLTVGIGIYYQNQQEQIQLKKEKQENEYKIERAEMILKGEKELRIKNEKRQEKAKELSDRVGLELCLGEAEEAYWDWIEYNGTFNKEEGTYWALHSDWDEAEKRKKSIEDRCFKQFK